MLIATIIAYFSCNCIFFLHPFIYGFSIVIGFGFEYCTVKFPIVSFAAIIRIIRNVIVVGFVLVSGTVIVRLFQCNYRIVIVIIIVYLLYGDRRKKHWIVMFCY